MGQARYRMRLLDWGGLSVADFTDVDIRNLEITRQMNNYDYHTLAIDGGDPRRTAFKLDYIFEVWRRVDRAGADWYLEYGGFQRTPQDQLTTANHDIFTTYGRGYVDLLRRRQILYPAGTAFSGKSGPGETVMRAYVEENIGVSSSSGTRKRSGVPVGGAMIVGASTGRGETWQGKREWNNLLDVLQDIARTSDVDFTVTRQPTAPPIQFEFSTPAATDRSNSVIFSLANQNMENPLYVKSRTEESTVAIALGQGQSVNRATQVVTAAAAADSPWNDIEVTTEGRSNTNASELITAANEMLKEKQAQPSFTFDVLQIDSLQYGADYFVGDLVRAVYKDIDVTIKIVGCSISLNEGRETVRPIFQDLSE